MPAVVNEEECVGCGACVDVCPTEAITMTDDDVAKVDPETCTDCGTCVEECPSEAITMN